MKPDGRSPAARPGARGRYACLLVVLLAVWTTGAGWSRCSTALAAVGGAPSVAAPPSNGGQAGSTLESAAAKASSTGRAVAMSLIGLAFAVAATILAFRRDFKEAAGVFVVGIVAILLATPAGLSLMRSTVTSLFGAG